MKGILLALLVIPFVSCSVVESKQPVGARPADFRTVKLAGTWASVKDGDKAAFVIQDPERGTVVMFNGDDELQLHIRQTGGTVFASLKNEDNDHYAWALLDLKDDTLRIRYPDFDKFKDLVRAGKVPGKILQEEDLNEQRRVVRTGVRVVIDDPAGRWVEDLAAGKLGNPWIENPDPELKRIRGPIP